MRPKDLDPLRESLARDPAKLELVVAACNRTGAYLGADVVGCVDRASLEEVIDGGHYHDRRLVTNHEVFADVLRARGEMPPGLVDGENLFFFDQGETNHGTGFALARTLLRCRPKLLALIGFDGGQDARTRWQGTPGYPVRDGQPAVLESWRSLLAREVLHAAGIGLVGGAISLPPMRLLNVDLPTDDPAQNALTAVWAWAHVRHRQEKAKCRS